MSAHALSSDRGDLHPGLFRPFITGDGTLVQLRLPGGLASIGLLTSLVRIAEKGAGSLLLTSRGNLQLRGLQDPLPPQLIDAILATELVPTPSHERVRNILSSPLSGMWPVNRPEGPASLTDVRPLVLELDRLIRTDPMLADLSCRFLFVLDDGRGDLLAHPFDVAYRAVDAVAGEVRLGTNGHPGFRVSAAEAPAALVEVARGFQQLRAATTARLLHLRDLNRPLPGVRFERLGPLPVGPTVQVGAVGPHAVAGLPLGRITGTVLAALRRMTDRVVLTNQRSLIVPAAADRLAELAAAGLLIDPAIAGATTAGTRTPGRMRARVLTDQRPAPA